MKKRLPLTLRKLTRSSFFAVLVISSLYLPNAHAQATKQGSTYVLDTFGANFRGAIFVVDPEGRRNILSRLQDRAQGPTTVAGTDITVAPTGFIFVAAGPLVLKVNPLTGNRTAVTDLDNPDQGTLGTGLLGIAVDSTGQIYATGTAMTSLPPPDDVMDALFRIDPETGNRSIVSHLGDSTEGETAKGNRMLLETDTSLLLLNNKTIVRVNLTNGMRELVVDTDNTSPSVGVLAGVAKEPSGNLLLVGVDPTNKLLVRVIITTEPMECPPGQNPVEGGIRKLLTDGDMEVPVPICVVSDFANPEQGPLGSFNLEDVAVDASGQIFVVDQRYGFIGTSEGAVFKVDASTGERLVLSDFTDDTQGPTGFHPGAIELAIPVNPTTEDIRLARSVVVATESLKVQKGAVVQSGNLITNGSTGKTVINKAATTPAGFEVAANALIIKKQAVVGGDVVVDNVFKNQGTVEGTETITGFPILEALPPFQEAVTGDSRVLVQKGGFLSLPEGRFKSIIVQKDATLVLEGGVYEAETLKAAKGAEIVYEGPSELRMSKSAKFGKDSTVRPDTDSFLNATDAVFYPAASFKTGTGSEIQANVVGPDAVCKLGKSSDLIGSVYCLKVTLGKSSQVTLMNFLEGSIVGGE